jgi:hypothetical protein
VVYGKSAQRSLSREICVSSPGTLEHDQLRTFACTKLAPPVSAIEQWFGAFRKCSIGNLLRHRRAIRNQRHDGASMIHDLLLAVFTGVEIGIGIIVLATIIDFWRNR